MCRDAFFYKYRIFTYNYRVEKEGYGLYLPYSFSFNPLLHFVIKYAVLLTF